MYETCDLDGSTELCEVLFVVTFSDLMPVDSLEWTVMTT